ncbi:MAG: hypothetical protein JNL11_17405 [Bdellovibrionaceae bacterium]|nr:hypothetical protein [Pseudobdellovibrionaceae bacterium]
MKTESLEEYLNRGGKIEKVRDIAIPKWSGWGRGKDGIVKPQKPVDIKIKVVKK